MEMDRSVLSRIKEVLKANPRGMNVTEIVGEIKMNRQSVSKYLEMLVMSGHVDVRTFGPSRVYYLSQRLPISAMLSLSYDFIIILDKTLRIINVNDRFLEFTGTDRESLMYKNVENFAFPLEFKPSIIPNVRDALRGSESAVEALYRKKGKEWYFNIKFIPMVLDDGDKGITIIIEDITKKKQIENELKESEDKFRSIIEQSLDGVALIDEAGAVVEYNDGLARITGYGRDEVIGKILYDLPFMLMIIGTATSGDINQFKNELKAFLTKKERTGQRYIYEYNICRKDGNIITTQTAAFKIQTAQGNMICVIVRDITENKTLENELRKAHDELEARVRQRTMELNESQRTLSTLISNLPGIVYRCRNDEFWTMDFISDGCRMITGYEPSDFIGNRKVSYEEIIHPDDRKMVRDTIDIALGRGGPFKIAYRINTASGEIRWVYEQGRGVFSPRGELIDIEGYITDITDIRSLNAARVKNEEKYRALVENVSDGIWETDKNLVFTYMSPHIYEMIGLLPEEAIGKTPYDLMTRDEAERMKVLVKPLGIVRKPFSFIECFLKHKNGDLIKVEINGNPIFDGHGDYYGYVGITRIKK